MTMMIIHLICYSQSSKLVLETIDVLPGTDDGITSLAMVLRGVPMDMVIGVVVVTMTWPMGMMLRMIVSVE